MQGGHTGILVVARIDPEGDLWLIAPQTLVPGGELHAFDTESILSDRRIVPAPQIVKIACIFLLVLAGAIDPRLGIALGILAGGGTTWLLHGALLWIPPVTCAVSPLVGMTIVPIVKIYYKRRGNP